jgi:hypothetical protein
MEINRVLKKCNVGGWNRFICENSCENGNEILHYTEVHKPIHQLSDVNIPRRDLFHEVSARNNRNEELTNIFRKEKSHKTGLKDQGILFDCKRSEHQ